GPFRFVASMKMWWKTPAIMSGQKTAVVLCSGQAIKVVAQREREREREGDDETTPTRWRGSSSLRAARHQTQGQGASAAYHRAAARLSRASGSRRHPAHRLKRSGADLSPHHSIAAQHHLGPAQ